MKSRLDRYKDDNYEIKTSSRLSKNKHLYDELNNKIGFEELVDFNTQTRIELTSLNTPARNRESYQQLKDYQSLIASKNEIEPSRNDEEKIKVFDINSVLEEARKNRNEIDDLEKKRKLKKEEYNILSDLNKKYLSNSEIKKEKDEYEGLEELIHTITSKTLVQDIKEAEEDEDLFSDLVATSVDLQVKAPSENEKIDITGLIDTVKFEEENDEEDEITKTGKVANSFYTRSMDLSEHDFDFDEATERKASVRHGILITIVIILLLIVIAIVSYFILQNYGIDLLELLKNFGK